MFNQITPVVKNLIIINVIMFLATMALPADFGHWMTGYNILNINFRPWQIVTHMFMHGGFTHILFNMYGLFLFGSALEHYWGPKRFLTYYMLSGLGAFFLYEGIVYYQIQQMMAGLTPEQLFDVQTLGYNALNNGQNFVNSQMAELNFALHGPVGMLGASGALFGVMLAFGMLFPNQELMLLFPPIPIKARWFVIGYGAIELLMALRNAPDDNVAHYAHLGGMIFGYLILKYWQRKNGNYY